MDVRLLSLPLMMAMLVGVASQLEDIAMDSSDKALRMSDSMNNAMDCAALGISIYECSPELRNTDFTPEREQFISVIDELRQLNTTINETNSTAYLILV